MNPIIQRTWNREVVKTVVGQVMFACMRANSTVYGTYLQNAYKNGGKRSIMFRFFGKFSCMHVMLMPNIGKPLEKRFDATLSMVKDIPCKGFTLDIGCGENPYIFHEHLNNYIGMDIDISILKMVSQNLPNVSLICASGSHAPFKDHSFDLIIVQKYWSILKIQRK